MRKREGRTGEGDREREGGIELGERGSKGGGRGVFKCTVDFLGLPNASIYYIL